MNRNFIAKIGNNQSCNIMDINDLRVNQHFHSIITYINGWNSMDIEKDTENDTVRADKK